MSEIAEEFASSLSELTVNSKPHINMLTMLADDNLEFAPVITQTILSHLQKVAPEIKLPVLYLIDSIVKNVGKAYKQLFTQSIVQHFTNTFEVVDEKTREQMFKLRQTWSDVLPAKTMYALDARVHKIDPAWPISAAPPTSVHINPKFFKSDILDKKSLTSTLKQPDLETKTRSQHSDSKRYKPRSGSGSGSRSSRSRKVSPPSPVGGVSPVAVESSGNVGVGIVKEPPPVTTKPSLREQMIMKQKMLLELQQKKLKLELLETQAQLDEQQKQLEKSTKSASSTAELTKLQKIVLLEEAKLKVMGKSLKKEMAMKVPRLQEVHRVTTDMKARAAGLLVEGSRGGPESLVKPAALLELKDSKPRQTVKSSVKPVSLPLPERQTLVAAADSTEDVAPPVRIAPVSTQLINAALSYGRNVRDPRIRQMSSRLETQLNNVSVPSSQSQPSINLSIPPPPPPPLATNKKTPSLPVQEDELNSKSKKDKKSISVSQSKERSIRSVEEDKKHYTRSSSRSSERSSGRSSGKDKSSSTKKSEEKSDKKSKIEDLFSTPASKPMSRSLTTNSKSPLKTKSPNREQLNAQKSHSPSSKVHSKRNQSNAASHDEAFSKKLNTENVTKLESSPKRTKLDSSQEIRRYEDFDITEKQAPKLSMDGSKSQIKPLEVPRAKHSPPDALDNSIEMQDEDIENIVKNPRILSKTIKLPEVQEDHSKSSDDSVEGKFEDIIRHPTKHSKLEKSSEIKIDRAKMNLLFDFDPPVVEHIVKPELKDNYAINSNSNEAKVNITENEISQMLKPKTDSIQELENQEVKTETSETTLTEPLPKLTNDPRFNKPFILDEMKYEECDTKMIIPNEIELSQMPLEDNEVTKQRLDRTDVFSPAKSDFDYERNKNICSEEVNTVNNADFGKDESLKLEIEHQSSELNVVNLSEESSKGDLPLEIPLPPPELKLLDSPMPVLKTSDQFLTTPQKAQSPLRNIEVMETIDEINENIPPTGVLSPKKLDKRLDSPINEGKKPRREKPSIMEQIIADAEKHEASPSPPPPPIISDKFKEIKPSSLNRLRSVGRPREDLHNSDSPEPADSADVDLRMQIQAPTLPKDPKNEVLGLAEKDVDLRSIPPSPTKKRPSMEKILDAPPAKKSKSEVIDGSASIVAEIPVCKIRYLPARPDPAHWYNNSRYCVYKRLFGSEDVDLRPVLCPPIPSPPPPPIISSPTPSEGAGEKLWAHYKQTRPDYKPISRYTPSRSRTDRTHPNDKFNRTDRYSSDGGSWHGRSRSISEDVDMRAQQPLVNLDGSYNQIVMQALEQHKRGELNTDEYRRVLSEVFSLREKRQLEEAQRREEEEAAHAELLEPISDEDISGGSLSGVEDAPSPTDSYSGTEDIPDSNVRKLPSEKRKVSDTVEDLDPRLPSTGVDIRIEAHSRRRSTSSEERSKSDDKLSRKSRGVSPYSRKMSPSEKVKYRSSRDEMREQRRVRRRERERRSEEEERGLKYRKSRYQPELWEEKEMPSPTSEKMEVDGPAARVPPLPPYTHDGPASVPGLTPVVRPPWDSRGPWLPTPPQVRGPPTMARFLPPRWRPPGPGPAPIFDGDPGSRFTRFGPPPGPLGRFPSPLISEVPPTDPTVLKLIEEDPTKTISIDGVSRDIRFYGATAVAFMSWDDPREVTFQPGSRRVFIDDRDCGPVHFNHPPVEMMIEGKPHRVRFGAPTRELYIDSQWYELFFGGPPVKVEVAGQPRHIRLEGPPPSVRPSVPRRDLVVGKVTLIIDAKMFFTVYLDAKPQKFEVNGVPYIIRFVEALQKTVINGVPFKSDFGGLPKSIILNGTKYFFRLTALPRGVVPGFLTIVNMEGGRLSSPTPGLLPTPAPAPGLLPTLPAPPQLPSSLEQAMDFKLDIKSDLFSHPPPLIMNTALPPVLVTGEVNTELELTSAQPPAIPPSVTFSPALSQPPSSVNPLDMLTTLMPAPEPNRAVDYSYSVDNENSNPSNSQSASGASTAAGVGDINVTELLAKLMATGIVPSMEQPKTPVGDKDKVSDKQQGSVSTPSSSVNIIKPVDFRKPETLKIRQTTLIANLYSGIQCNSCGVRFPPEQTMKYSQHLDWHFRQNRRDKDSSRSAQTRRYYYDVNDWVQFEEIEDLEERAQPYFEMVGAGPDGGEEEAVVPVEVVSVRAADYGDDPVCQICNDKFESFYNEEKEEWQLPNAQDHEGKLVHPVCLEDQRAAAEKPIVVDDIDITDDNDEPKKVDEKEEEVVKHEEDDDIMEVTDLEVVLPVFPVEDLTVSDTESVADDNEKANDVEELEVIEVKKTDNEESVEATTTTIDDNETEPDKETEIEEGSTKEEDSQDDIVLVDKSDDEGEDSQPNSTEILEVVRNIKRDPDALGGEYEEIGLDPDIEIKKEKGEIPMPDPVVDTTHTTVTCLIDGNVELDDTPQQLNVGGPPKIKINITKPTVQPAPEKPKEIEPVEAEPVDSEGPNVVLPANLSLVTQPPPPGEEPVPQYVKPKLIGHKLQDLPPVFKGSELSGLCSIM